jgi:hypothetical protein
MREHHLRILGLPPQATLEEIKRRYRELVMRFHPDVNPDPQAAEEFLKIQAAYEKVMGDDPELARIVSAYRPPKRKTKSPEAARAEYIRQRMSDYIKQRDRESKEIEAQMFNTLTQGWIDRIAKVFGTLSALFGIIMLVDFFVAPTFESDEVMTKAYHEHFQRNTIYFKSSNPIDVPEQVYLKVNAGDMFSLRYSGITHEFEAWEVLRPGAQEPVILVSEFNFFTLFPLFPVLFLIPGLIWFYRRNTTFFYILYLLVLVPFPALLLHYGLREQKFTYILNYFF